MRKRVIYFIVMQFLWMGVTVSSLNAGQGNLSFEISFQKQLSTSPQDGRILLLISNDGKTEPRYQVGEYHFLSTQLVFGKDVDRLFPGECVVMDDTDFGFPLKSMAEIPPGEYFVQAVFHLYETFRRADGHVVKLPMDRGEGQRWNRAPGNFFSLPQKIRMVPGRATRVTIAMNQVNPPVSAFPDTKYIRHIRIKSTLLSRFWGRPMHLGAAILLPEGFSQHPEVRYPLVIRHGHYSPTIYNFRETPPAAELQGRRRAYFQKAHDFYRAWIRKGFPRVILASIQHPTPYYDDSYGVNSANNGPYGDAILQELIPYIEKEFRGIGGGWARTLYGGSTGGWTALAQQIFYPDEFNGCWAACPDSVDFHSHILVNLYQDTNMYYRRGTWIRYRIPGARDTEGNVLSTNEAQNHRELAFATRGRSGFQWDGWESVFSPVGPGGYPMRLFDKLSGEIDPLVAEYWKENYDLRHILERDWAKIGAQLVGKIHIYAGDMDSFYLNNPVVRLEKFLESTTEPYFAGEIRYGDGFGHCWSGHPSSPLAGDGCPSDAVFYIPLMVKRIRSTAPKGADIASWLY